MDTSQGLPSIDPMPARAAGFLPWVGAGVALLRHPTEFFRRTRARLGNTFVVDAFGYRLFAVFSPAGVRQLYALPESQASFGLATYELVLKHKLPLELLAGRRNFPHTLFGGQGTCEVFATMRRLGHRLGLSSWAGHEAASPRYLDLEQCANESIRLAQRSITLRQVLSPLDFDDGARTYRLAPGTMITTMLSLTNPSAAAGLERFDPEHYTGRRLADTVDLPARELVSTFGHGRHACPAQRFSISAIRIAVRRLVDAYDFTPRFTRADPRPRQIGGVARAARPCSVGYARR